MPRIPRARAKGTPRAGIIPCVHSVTDAVPKVTCYAVGELEPISIHWIEGQSWQPCTKGYTETGGRCRYCDSPTPIAPRNYAYFPALMRTQGPEGKTFTPVAISVPEMSRQSFPEVKPGMLLEVIRDKRRRLKGSIITRVALPPGVVGLFDVHDVLEYRWFRNLDPSTPVPEIPGDRMQQVIEGLFALEREQQTAKGKVEPGQSLEHDVTRLSEKELIERTKLSLPRWKLEAEQELRRRGVKPWAEVVEQVETCEAHKAAGTKPESTLKLHYDPDTNEVSAVPVNRILDGLTKQLEQSQADHPLERRKAGAA